MKIQLASTLRHYHKKNIPQDLLAGVIIAAVSIPISMGYAQIAGLPAVYGLYGSVFPIILFALFSTSPQFIFGVDAAPAAMVGSALLVLGIEEGSTEAMTVVPVMTLLVAVWLFLFFIFKAGRLVKYISEPVMGGFITGICTTIILMQAPKLMGGKAGVGELKELLPHLYDTIKVVNIPSLILGLVALAILLISKKLIPKFPMAVVLMILGAVLSLFLPLKDYGIATLTAVSPGLPAWRFPTFTGVPVTKLITLSLSVAAVIMAETLLAELNFSRKNNYKINDNQELLAFSLGNLAASLTGCCPINGSVSRTAMNDQYQGKTQLTSLVAGIAMILVLLFGTGFIGYLPVPVLTAIVISALIGATEFHLAKRLWRISKKECAIFYGAFVGVLLFGTINGVLIGIILSFADLVLRMATPIRCFMGIMPGHKHFRNIAENPDIHPVEGVVIYRFSGSLFFANADILLQDIESGVKPDTKAVILDASAIGSIDITAATRLESLYKSLKTRGIQFYITEHISSLNDQFRSLGLSYMIDEGVVRRTTHVALKNMGINRPYPLEGIDNHDTLTASQKRADNKMQEFVWAYGSDSDAMIEKQIQISIEHLKETGNIDNLFHNGWQYMEAIDEDIWIEHLEEHLQEIAEVSKKDIHVLAQVFEQHRTDLLDHLLTHNPEAAKQFIEKRQLIDRHMKEHHPEIYTLIQKNRNK